MSYELFGYFLVIAGTLAFGYGLASSPRNPFPVRLVLLAVVLRIVGSLARFDMIRLFYGGVADAQRYFVAGKEIAERIRAFDPVVFSYPFWFGGAGRWWGTDFTEKLTGLVVGLVGPTMRGAYLCFSMMAFAGLYLVALAVYRHRPGPGAVRFATWIWLWPSLWFWPSSIGKEAVSLLAIGLVVYGYAGRKGIRWFPFAAGLGLAFALRPHVAAVLGLATLAAYWLQSWRRLSLRRFVELAAAMVLSLLLLTSMAAQFGLDADLEGVQEFVSYRSGQTMEGGSALGGAPAGLAAIPMAFVNIWMRPFPWDVHNLMALFSALEVLGLWAVVWWRRRTVAFVFRRWRHDRLLAFALPFLAGYTLMIGLTFANLGIIARQRSPLFPFVFMVVTAAGAGLVIEQRQRRAARRRRLAPPVVGPRVPAAAGAGGRAVRARRTAPVTRAGGPRPEGEPSGG